MPTNINPGDFHGCRTLITGDVNTGKTTLTRRVCLRTIECAGPENVAVIDLAPDIPPASGISVPGVGGRLFETVPEGVLYLADRIIAPRLTAKTEQEAMAFAEQNRDRIDALFTRFAGSGRPFLFINDLSMYLQAGRSERLAEIVLLPDTVAANGYSGKKLGTGALSRREGLEMKKAMRVFDRVIHLETQFPPLAEM